METNIIIKEVEDFINGLQEKPIIIKMRVKGIIDRNKEIENLHKVIKEESEFKDGHIHTVIGEDMAIGENFKDWIIDDVNFKYVSLVKKDGKWRKHHIVYRSIETAMLGLLEYKYEGLNSQFSMFASRMLGID